jgi:hypothetical protein
MKRAIAVITFGSLATLGLLAQAPQKNWKDRAEYDLFDSAQKEQNATTKLQILNNWKQKYPTSDFKVDREAMIMDTYRTLGNGKEMMNAAKELISLDPNNIQGLYWINLLTISLQDKSPEALTTGENAAKGLLAAAPAFFDPAKKPAAVSEEAWKKELANMEMVAHRTLGWVAMQRKQSETDQTKALALLQNAEAEFNTVLTTNPNDAEASYWAGTVLAMQRKLEKQSAALFHFARAAYHDGPGALPPATRTPLQAYLEKTYINFHGSKDGLDQLIALAKPSALPPADFKIESKDEILAKQQEELKKTNPQLALWVNIKRELSGPNGQQYFDTNLKGAAIPGGVEGIQKFKATVVSTTTDKLKRTTSIVVGISAKEMSEVTLNLDKPHAGPVPAGTEIEFSGVPSSFTADPFNLTFDVTSDDIAGLPKPAAPARRAPAKKGSSKGH